jgi:GNAT superfamily N-acetyltransferase
MNVAWMVQKDLLSVEEFDSVSLKKVILFLTKPNSRGMVIYNEVGEVAGYALFSIRKTKTKIRRLVVKPSERRNGYGSTLINAICDIGKDCVEVDTKETDLLSQQFLKKNGFLGTLSGDMVSFARSSRVSSPVRRTNDGARNGPSWSERRTGE